MRDIEDLLEPSGDLLLVRRRAPSEYASNRIIAPESVRGSRGGVSALGVILKAGPYAPNDLYAGRGVVLGVFAGTAVALESCDTADHVWMVSPSEVKATFDPQRAGRHGVEAPAGGELADQMLEEVEPRDYEMLCERLEIPMHRGPILLPSGSRETKRAAEAVVRKVGPLVEGFEPGDKVLLRASATRGIDFGSGAKRTLWIVQPDQVLARLNEFPDNGKLTTEGRHHLANMESVDYEPVHADDGKLPEGDSRGLL